MNEKPFLRATLFRSFRLYMPNDQLLDPGSPTTRSLFAYLLLHRQPVERRRLAFTFWPDVSETAARRNLRQYLHQIRLMLNSISTAEEWFWTQGDLIQLHPNLSISLDVEKFLHETRPEASLEELERALSRYTGDLLEECYDEWCLAERERLRQRWLKTLDRYSEILQHAHRFQEAIAAVYRWTQAEPLDETAQRRLMTLYALNGERTKAIQSYQAFSQRLAAELGTAPSSQTQVLFQAIQKGEIALQPVEPPSPPLPPVLPNKPVSRPPAPLIGRTKEQTLLETAYHQAANRKGQFILITGEAGIGKTRLVQEYLAGHPNAPCLQSACYEMESMIAFAPLRRALEAFPLPSPLLHQETLPDWAANILTLFPHWANRFSHLAAPLLPPDPFVLREGAIQLLLYVTEYQNAPLHLILDDLHWADTSTWEWLAALARRSSAVPLLVISILRMEDMPAERRALLRSIQRSNSVLPIELTPLTFAETTDLARFLAPDKAENPIFLQRLYQETEGNPFFVIETIRAWHEAPHLPLATFSPSIPHTIQRIIEARLDQLSPESREALIAAAVIGQTFTLPFLQAILEISDQNLIGFIETWLERGLIHETPQGYDFRHDTFRQVIYAGASRARREFLHGRIASVLEFAIPPAGITTLAYHYARSSQPLKALPYLTQAGEQALSLRSYHEARQFGLQAINLLGQLPGPRQRNERIDINLQLAQAYAFTGDLQRAIEILNETEHLAQALGDQLRLGKIFRRAAQFFWLSGQPAAASDYARRCLRTAEELNDPDLRDAALRMLGRVSIALSAFDDAIAYLQRYINLYDERKDFPSSVKRPADLPIVLGYLGVAYSRVGAWERALSSARRGLEMAETYAGNPLSQTSIFARMQFAMVQAELHRWDECLTLLASLPVLHPPEEITPPLYMALSLKGLAQAHSGEIEAGIQTLRRCLEWAEQTRHRVFHYIPCLFLAESLNLNKQFQEAADKAQAVIREARQAGDRWVTGVALKLLAEIGTRLPVPDWSQIEQDLIEALHLLRKIRARPVLARTYLALRRLYDRAGQIAWAVDCHFRATTIFDELGMEQELLAAQGQAAGERQGAVVIPNLPLKGPNASFAPRDLFNEKDQI